MNDVQQLRLVGDDNSPAEPPPTSAPDVHPMRTCSPPSLDQFGEVLTVEEAASVLRISRASAYEAARTWRATRRDGLPCG